MLKNYIKIAGRNLLRRKLFSFINLSGLALAIAFMLLIGSFIYFEYSYNSSFSQIDSIYRLFDSDDKDYHIDYRVRDVLNEKIVGVEKSTILYKRAVEVNSREQVFLFNNLLYVDKHFFEMFDGRFLAGNPERALTTIDAIVLTESVARKLFGQLNPIGQIIIIDHEFQMRITAIVEDMPANSALQADLFISSENIRQKRLPMARSCQQFDGTDDSSCKYPVSIFVQLDKRTDPRDIAESIPSLFDLNDFRFPDHVQLLPLKTNYFNLDYPDTDLLHGNITQVRSLALIGFIILLLAAINYSNLTTAAYRNRVKEIGMKRCLGADRNDLSGQFLIEALFFTVFAAGLGIIFAEIFLPYFNQYIEKDLIIPVYSNVHFAVLFLIFIVLLSLLTGFLPALILSRISPLALFRFRTTGLNKGNGLRGVLSIFQFGVAIVLICLLLVILRQVDYAKHKNPGFAAEQLLYLNIHYKMRDKLPELKSILQQYHGMKSMTVTNGIPGKINITLDDYKTIVIDSATLGTFGFRIIEGRSLLPGDLNRSCLVNRSALARFNNGNFQRQKINGSEVVGVVSDFHFAPVYQKIAPLVLFYSDWGGMHLTMRITGPVGEAILYIRQSWMNVCPDFPYDLHFYDDTFAAMYRQDENLAQLVKIFAILAVAISCMGILGLAVFQSGQRVKEIGIRKVLGASVTEIITMLTANFTRWVLIANVIAWPLAYYITSTWLQNYAYRIELSWWMFGLSGVIALVIALLTVSLQAIRAARANPVESLRYE